MSNTDPGIQSSVPERQGVKLGWRESLMLGGIAFGGWLGISGTAQDLGAQAYRVLHAADSYKPSAHAPSTKDGLIRKAQDTISHNEMSHDLHDDGAAAPEADGADVPASVGPTEGAWTPTPGAEPVGGAETGGDTAGQDGQAPEAGGVAPDMPSPGGGLEAN